MMLADDRSVQEYSDIDDMFYMQDLCIEIDARIDCCSLLLRRHEALIAGVSRMDRDTIDNLSLTLRALSEALDLLRDIHEPLELGAPPLDHCSALALWKASHVATCRVLLSKLQYIRRKVEGGSSLLLGRLQGYSSTLQSVSQVLQWGHLLIPEDHTDFAELDCGGRALWNERPVLLSPLGVDVQLTDEVLRQLDVLVQCSQNSHELRLLPVMGVYARSQLVSAPSPFLTTQQIQNHSFSGFSGGLEWIPPASANAPPPSASRRPFSW